MGSRQFGALAFSPHVRHNTDKPSEPDRRAPSPSSPPPVTETCYQRNTEDLGMDSMYEPRAHIWRVVLLGDLRYQSTLHFVYAADLWQPFASAVSQERHPPWEARTIPSGLTVAHGHFLELSTA